MLGKQGLGLLHRLADDLAADLHAIRAQLELVPGRAGAAGLLLAAVLLLILLAGGLEVDAKQRRPNQRQNDRGADGSENVADGVGHRHRVQQLLGFLRRQTEAIDRVGRQAHRRRDRLRSGIEPRRRADVIARELCAEIGGAQTEEAYDDGKQRLWKPVLRDAAHELRSDAVTDREQEHQEEERLERTADRDPKLSDDHRRDQGRGHRSETQTLIGKGAEIVAERQG